MKTALRALFAVPALWEVWRFRLLRGAIGEERAFRSASERLAGRPGYYGLYLRAAVYSRLLERTSPEIEIGYGTCLSKRAASLGEHVYVGRHCSLGLVDIDNDVMIADHVAIPSGGDTHVVDGAAAVPPRDRPNRYLRVRVGEGSWIGSSAVVMADVGRFCVIGAGAVVTRPVPDHSVAVGVPARVVGSTRPA